MTKLQRQPPGEVPVVWDTTRRLPRCGQCGHGIDGLVDPRPDAVGVYRGFAHFDADEGLWVPGRGRPRRAIPDAYPGGDNETGGLRELAAVLLARGPVSVLHLAAYPVRIKCARCGRANRVEGPPPV